MISKYYGDYHDTNYDKSKVSSEKLAAFIWNALVALYIHKESRPDIDSKSENNFLLRWFLKTIRNEVCFSKYSDVIYFLYEDALNSGLIVSLHSYLLNLWISNAEAC